MNILAKIGILGAIVLLACGFSLIWIGEEKTDFHRDEKGTETVPSRRSSPIRMEGIYFLEKQENQKTWELEAKSAEFAPEEDIVLLEDIQAAFYTLERNSEAGPAVQKEESTAHGRSRKKSPYAMKLEADSGRIHRKTKEMDITGDVKLFRNDGISIVTHSLRWNNAKREIHTDDPVNIRSENMEIRGKGMVSQADGSSMRVIGPIDASLYR